MNDQQEYERKLYTTPFHGFALQRSGASRHLKCQKYWSPDGKLVELKNHSAMIPAYVLQELMIQPFKGQIEFIVTGNLDADLSHAVHSIVKLEMAKSKMMFRCWSFDRYIDCGVFTSKQAVVFDSSGRPLLMNVQKNSFGVPRMVLSDDDYKLKSLEIERFTGYMDKNYVPIMENDVVMLFDDIFSIKAGMANNSGWELMPLAGSSVPMLLTDFIDGSLIANQTAVIGSARMDGDLINSLRKLVTEFGR